MVKPTQILPKEGSQFIWLCVILIDSVLRTGKNYYPQLFLEECEYVVKEQKDAWVYCWQLRNFFWLW